MSFFWNLLIYLVLSDNYDLINYSKIKFTHTKSYSSKLCTFKKSITDKVDRKKKITLKKSLLALATIIVLLPITLLLCVYFGAFGKIETKEELKNIQSYIASEVVSDEEEM